MHRIILFSIVVLAIAGCESDPHAVFASPGAITAPILGLKGGSLDHAVAYLGPPDSEQKLDAGSRVLLWNGEAGTSARPTYRTASTPHCRIKAVVGGDGTVSSVEIDANSAFYCPRGKH